MKRRGRLKLQQSGTGWHRDHVHTPVAVYLPQGNASACAALSAADTQTLGRPQWPLTCSCLQGLFTPAANSSFTPPTVYPSFVAVRMSHSGDRPKCNVFKCRLSCVNSLQMPVVQVPSCRLQSVHCCFTGAGGHCSWRVRIAGCATGPCRQGEGGGVHTCQAPHHTSLHVWALVFICLVCWHV